MKQNGDLGLILNQNDNECKIDCYPDTDFAGMYGHEKPTDPACVKSRTGLIITFADCLVLWVSKLQQETALSTIKAEIISLAHNCCKLFPIIDMMNSLGEAIGLPIRDTTMNVLIHEDNMGALVLVRALPPQFTPRGKFYAAKTIWFCEDINKQEIKLLKIDTVEKLGEIFIKGLP